ncbi:restriction endonuclease [Luteimonas sp. A478]
MRHRLKHVSRRHNDALAKIRWDRLEHLLADHYRAQGYNVDHVGTGGAGARFDGGIDLKLRRGTEYVVVQVKHWNAYQVPHNEVHQLIGLMVNDGATGAVLITSGEFTKAAIEAATRHGHVQLVDGQELRALLGLREGPAADPGASLGGRIALGIGEHMVHAALGRVTGDRGQGRRGGREGIAHGIGVSVGISLAKLAVTVVLFLILFLFIRNAFTSAVSGLSQPTQPKPAATQRAAPVGQPATVRSNSSATPIATIKACEELIDTASGTYINHCTRHVPDGPPVHNAPTQAAPKTRAAIDILSDSTPEM